MLRRKKSSVLAPNFLLTVPGDILLTIDYKLVSISTEKRCCLEGCCQHLVSCCRRSIKRSRTIPEDFPAKEENVFNGISFEVNWVFPSLDLFQHDSNYATLNIRKRKSSYLKNRVSGDFLELLDCVSLRYLIDIEFHQYLIKLLLLHNVCTTCNFASLSYIVFARPLQWNFSGSF